MSFDISKPYRCRDGRFAYAHPLPAPHKGFAGYINTGSEILLTRWSKNGRLDFASSGEFGGDLVNLPETRIVKVWINIYQGGDDRCYGFGAYDSEQVASRYRTPSCLASIERELTFTIGEGLEP